jgi:4-amino-4-deoxy-L-arabinose transferase-like glycosyltransferase
VPGGTGMPGGAPGGGFGGGSGITRLFGEQVGGQISWLLPLCLLILVAFTIAGLSLPRSQPTLDPARRAGWVLWGGWLLLVGLVLSFAQGGFHPYYTTEMAPALAAVTAAGVAAMWRHYRRPGGYRWLLFPAAVALTVGWAWLLVSRDISWNGWLRYAVASVGVAAVVLLLAGRRSLRGMSSAVTRVAGVLSVVALLLAPGVWSIATAFAASGGGGAMAQAGPPGTGFGSGRGRLGPARADLETRGSVPARFRGAMSSLTAEQSAILAYAQANSAGHRITLAVEGGAMAADAYLIHSDAVIVGMGGFSGQDPAPTAATLTQWVQHGELRFVLAGGHGAHGGSGSPGSGGGESALRTQWVQQHCAVVSPSAYGASDRIQVLYDCAG